MLPVQNPDVIYQALEEGAVLFSVKEEVYFGLNPVGARVWEALPLVTGSWDELFAALEARYPAVDPTTLRADVRELVNELLAHGLVRAEKAE